MAVVLPPLLADLKKVAPHIDLSTQQLLPPRGILMPERAWNPALVLLETRAIDIAIAPLDETPARFVAKTLYEEDFVIAMRAGHPFADDPTLERYCRMQHVVVSLTGDAHGFVDEALAKLGRARRIALAVPNFMLALALIAETDLICALPRRFVDIHRRRFGVTSTDAPLRLPDYRIRAIAPKVAMMDAGVAWLFDRLVRVTSAPDTGGKRRRRNGRS